MRIGIFVRIRSFVRFFVRVAPLGRGANCSLKVVLLGIFCFLKETGKKSTTGESNSGATVPSGTKRWNVTTTPLGPCSKG